MTASGIGSFLGGKVGGWVGDLASKAMSLITGMGDYEVKENSIVQSLGAGGSGQVPQFLSAGGCSRISHREFLGLVTSPGSAFTLSSFPINPFNPTTFPWLSEIAGSFETFRFRGIVVEFVSTYGDAVASTNASLGSVILATQYNTAAPAFATQSQMENYQYATSCKPSVSMIHPVECDPSQLPMEHLYVFPTTLLGIPSDPRWSTLGTTYLATVGQQSAATLGELWISFDIEFYQPKLISSVASNGLAAHYFLNNIQASSWNGNAPVPPTVLTAPTVYSGDLILAPNGSLGFTFPAGLSGTYLVVLSISCPSGTSVTSPPWTAPGNPLVTNGSSVFVFGNGTGATPPPANVSAFAVGSYNGGATTHGSCLVVAFVKASPPSLTTACSVDLSCNTSTTFGGTVTGVPLGIDLVVTAVSINM